MYLQHVHCAQEPLLCMYLQHIYLFMSTRYRLSSGASDSSEDEFYDKKEEAIFGRRMDGANSEKKPLSNRSHNLIKMDWY